jgi:hypothetical protein
MTIDNQHLLILRFTPGILKPMLFIFKDWTPSAKASPGQVGHLRMPGRP